MGEKSNNHIKLQRQKETGWKSREQCYVCEYVGRYESWFGYQEQTFWELNAEIGSDIHSKEMVLPVKAK